MARDRLSGVQKRDVNDVTCMHFASPFGVSSLMRCDRQVVAGRAAFIFMAVGVVPNPTSGASRLS